MTSTVSRHCFESRRVRYRVARMSLWRLAAYNPLTSKIWRIQANSILLCGGEKKRSATGGLGKWHYKIQTYTNAPLSYIGNDLLIWACEKI